MLAYQIRPFNPTDAEYDAIVHVYNLAKPGETASAVSWRHWDKHRDPVRMFQRHVMVQAGKITGYGYLMKSDPEAGLFHFAIFLPPQVETPQLIAQFYNYLAAVCHDNGALSLMTQIVENEAQKIDWLSQHGFQPVMRYPRSLLAVADFKAAPYAGLLAKLAKRGIEIAPLNMLQERDDDWRRRVYELHSLVSEDVPSPHAYTLTPFEQFVGREFDDPDFMPEGWFIALAHQQYIGLSALLKEDAGIDRLVTGITGVLRSQRRLGVATALKVRSIQFAQQLGTRFIRTSNEENNPMFQLNLKLGFVPQPAEVDWKRVIK